MDGTVSNLGIADLAVLGAYFVIILGVGFWAGRGESNTHEYFLGGRRQNWLLVGLSILATEVSAVTFLIVPGRAYVSNWWYLQMYVGALLGKFLIAYLLLPAFYGGKVTTVYEYLGTRFGPKSRVLASLMFFASRILGSSIRLLAASIAISVIFDWPLWSVVALGASVAIFYATFGGIKSIIYTDAFQAVVLLVSGVAVVVYLFYQIPDTWMANLSTAADLGKLKVFHWDEPFNGELLFWALMIHSTVQTMAAMGVDQDLTQRMLTCPDLKRGQRSLILNAIIGAPVPCIFLLIGTLIFVYSSAPGATWTMESVEPKEVFGYFIAHGISGVPGLKGLLIAGVFAAAMSSLDSALGALSSSAVTDFYKPYWRRDASASHYLRAARIFTFVFGILLAIVALQFADHENLLTAAFSYASLVFGGMLGVFLIGVTSRSRGSDNGNVFAMLSSMALLITIKEYHGAEGPIIAWPWWVVIGAAWTWIVGVMFRTKSVAQ